MNKLSLVFEEPLIELRYYDYSVDHKLKRVRIGLLLTIALFTSFFLVDLFTEQNNFYIMLYLRIGGVASICGLLYFLSGKSFFKRHLNTIMSYYALFVSAMLWMFVALSSGTGRTLYPMGFILVISWLFFLSGLKFIESLIHSFAVIMIFTVASVMNNLFDINTYLVYIFYLFANLIICAINGYTGEKFSRKNYLAYLNEGAQNESIEGLCQQLQEETNMRAALNDDLRKSNSRLEMALQASHTGLWEWDMVSGVSHLSKEWYDMLGYAPNKLESDEILFEKLLHPEDKDRVFRSIDRHVQGGETDHYQETFRLHTNEDSWKWVMSRGQITKRDEEGTPPLLMTGIHMDIDSRKAMEEDLKRALNRVVTLYDASLSLSNFYDLPSILNVIAQKVREVIHYDSMTIQELRGDEFHVIYNHGFLEKAQITQLRFGIQDNPDVWEVVQSKKKD